MGEFRTVEQIRALTDLRAQEELLLEKAEAGEILVLGDGELPSAGDEARSIRAGIIRYLLLGGCEGLRCHEKGVQIMGAWVPDLLDLKGCDSDNALNIKNSRFSAPPMLQSARLRAVFLNGSYCPGIKADGLSLREDLDLRGGFQASGEVRLPGAEIGGELNCSDGIFSDEGGDALNADRAKVSGCVFLDGTFSAAGEVRLVGAEIGGSLECDGGTFSNEGGDALHGEGAKVFGSVFMRGTFNAIGEVRLLRAEIGGRLECDGGTFTNKGGDALNATDAAIIGTLFWRNGASAVGRIELSGASCANLNDDWGDWPEARGSLSLNHFTYGSIEGHGAVDAETRLKWLALDDVSHGFRPQPYQHLAKVLREMGHAEDARKVMVVKERLQRADARRRQRSLIKAAQNAQKMSLRLANPRPELTEDYDRERWLYKKQNTVEDDLARQTIRHTFARPGGDSDGRKAREGLDPASRTLAARGRRNDLRWEVAKARTRIGVSFIVQYVFDALIGFGYRPMRAVRTITVMLGFGWWLFAQTWEAGDMTPNSAPVLVSKAWTDVEHLPHPAEVWTEQARAGRDYETFDALAYSFDVVVPLIDLGQENAWAPSTSRSDWGRAAWWARWVLKIFGWFVTALGAAAVTGLVRRD